MCELVEVFSIAYIGGDGAAPSGKIGVYDGKRGQIIYRRRGMDKTHKPSHSGAQNRKNVVQLLLTGPTRAISADGCVAIESKLHHGCEDGATREARIFIDLYGDSTQYDVAITEAVQTCSCPHSPRAEVTYAILSDAVEASVEVKLTRRTDYPVYGKIVAHYARDAHPVVVLFESNMKNTSSSLSQEPTTVPLTRSVLAVPLEWPLKIDVDLRIQSIGENVKDFVVCQPNLDSEHRLVGQKGVVRVNIACSY